MKRLKHLVLLALAIVTALCVFAAPVTAKAVKTEFSTELLPHESTGPAKREWVDEEAILHVRRAPGAREMIGDLTGYQTFVTNINLDLATFDGEMWGEVTMYVTWHGLTGTFEARFSGTITAGIADANVIGHGTGDFEGMKLMGHFFDVPSSPGWSALEGIILDPHGG